MSTKLPVVVHVGAVVATPTGRLCIVRSIDERRQEASVEALPWGANFRLATLTPVIPGEAVVLLPFGTSAEHVTPAANDEEHEA